MFKKILSDFTTGSGSLTYAEMEKPVGERVFVRRVSVQALGTGAVLAFARCWGRFDNKKANDFDRALYTKWTNNAIAAYPDVLFDGNVEWYHDETLVLCVRTQFSNCNLIYIVEYEIGEPEKRRWW